MERIRVVHMVCKHLHACIALAVVLVLLSSFATFANNEGQTSWRTANRGEINDPLQQGPSVQDPRAPEMYTGEGVRLRAQQLRSTNKAIARAMKDLENRGLSPKWDQSLTILQTKSTSTAHIAGGAIQRVSYPQTWTNGSYELTLITYSNGHSQWEGIIYLHNPNEDDTYESLISTPASVAWDTVYEYWYPPDGGGGQCYGGHCTSQLDPKSSQNPKLGFINALYKSPTATLRTPGIFGRIKRWVGCVWGHRDLFGWCQDLVCAVQAAWFLISNC